MSLLKYLTEKTTKELVWGTAIVATVLALTWRGDIPHEAVVLAFGLIARAMWPNGERKA